MQVLRSIPVLSLSGNLQDLVLSAASDEVVTIKLYKGNELLIEELYKPDISGKIRIKHKNIISDELSSIVPTFNQSTFHQETGYADFKILASNTTDQSFEMFFRVIKGEVSTKILDTSNFLESNFMTWQPQLKLIQYHDPEWLTYYAIKYSLLKVTAYTYPDNVATTKTLAVLPAGELTTANMNYGLILSLFATIGIPQYYDVFVECNGKRKTYVQRYFFSQEQFNFNDLFVFSNSLGGIDTIRFTGEAVKKDDLAFKKALFEEETLDYTLDHQRAIKKDTGFFKSKNEKLWSFDFFASFLKFKNQDGTLLRIHTEDPELESIPGELGNYTFTYIFSNNSEAMNLNREHQAPPLLQLDAVDGSVFQMPPNINHYPFATNSDVIIPVQHPFENKWRKLSLSDLLLGLIDPGDNENGPQLNLIGGNFGVWTPLPDKNSNVLDTAMPLQFKADRISFNKRGIVFLTGRFSIKQNVQMYEIILGTLPEHARPGVSIQKYFITQNIEMFLEINTAGVVKVVSKDGFYLPAGFSGHAYFIDMFFNPDKVNLQSYTYTRTERFQRFCDVNETGTFVEFTKDYVAPTLDEAQAIAENDTDFETEGTSYADDPINGGICTINQEGTIYKSIRSGSFSRDCGSNYVGTSVIFTKEYSSFVSQSAADLKATNDTYNFNTLGQAYANNPENGATCNMDTYFVWGKIYGENLENIGGYIYADIMLRTYRGNSATLSPVPSSENEISCSKQGIEISYMQDEAISNDFIVNMGNVKVVRLVPPGTEPDNPRYPKQIVRGPHGVVMYCAFTGKEKDEMVLLQIVN